VPSKNLKQHKLMEAVAHNKGFAKKVGIPQSVGKDFTTADTSKQFKTGGDVASLKKLFKGKESKAEELKEAKAIKSGKISPEQYAKGEEMEKAMKKGGKCYAAGGVTKQLPSSKDMGSLGMKKGGNVKEVIGPKTMSKDVEKGSNKLNKFGESAVQKRGKTKGVNLGDSGKIEGIEGFKPKKFAAGGCTRADGIAQKGKTKGRYI